VWGSRQSYGGEGGGKEGLAFWSFRCWEGEGKRCRLSQGKEGEPGVVGFLIFFFISIGGRERKKKGRETLGRGGWGGKKKGGGKRRKWTMRRIFYAHRKKGRRNRKAIFLKGGGEKREGSRRRLFWLSLFCRKQEKGLQRIQECKEKKRGLYYRFS